LTGGSRRQIELLAVTEGGRDPTDHAVWQMLLMAEGEAKRKSFEGVLEGDSIDPRRGGPIRCNQGMKVWRSRIRKKRNCIGVSEKRKDRNQEAKWCKRNPFPRQANVFRGGFGAKTSGGHREKAKRTLRRKRATWGKKLVAQEKKSRFHTG